MPFIPMPPVVQKGDPAIQFLWNEVQLGKVHKTLPMRHAGLQDAWDAFLQVTGWSTINKYYGRRMRAGFDPAAHGRDEFMKFVRSGYQPPILFKDVHDRRKEVGERLVEEFADVQANIRAYRLSAARLQEMGKELRLGGTKRRRRQ